jgi:hypothetical protein
MVTWSKAWVAVAVIGLSGLCAPAQLIGDEQEGAGADAVSLRQLRADARKAQRRFQSLYDQLNQDSQQDVSCTDDAPTGTRFAKRKCTSRAAESARSEAISGYLDTTEANNAVGVQNGRTADTASPVDQQQVPDRYTARLSDTELSAQQQAFQKNLEKLMAANPELRKRYDEYVAASQRLQVAERAGSQSKPAQ